MKIRILINEVNAIQNILLMSSSVISGFFIVKSILKVFDFLRKIKEAETTPLSIHAMHKIR